MFLLFWSAKGGSGTTVVAAATALVLSRDAPAVVIDLGGDACAALGIDEGAGAGVMDWLGAPTATAADLFRLAVPATEGLSVVPTGGLPGDCPGVDWSRLAGACASSPAATVLDAGPHLPSTDAHLSATRSFLVVRPCFLALRAAARHHGTGSGVVLVEEPGRALRSADVERALGLPVRASLAWDPAVARAVDAGLLTARLPSGLGRSLRRLATTPASVG